jgi:hypothetical protein
MRQHKNAGVSRGGPEDDVLVEKNSTDLGAYTVQPLSGLMGLDAKDFIAPATGGVGYFAATWVLNKFSGKLPSFVQRFTPLLGGILGALLNGVALPAVKAGGKKIVAQAMATSITMGIMSQLLRETSGLGAVVMQRISGATMGALPARVQGAGSMPRSIRQTIDKGVYGRTWA